ncbi:MAG: SAM-dependent DNA methyltransferase [Chloroflexi bacterium]|nr:SAM-dependent DNA methyltransferase [Chloroflexota bacterium]
MTSPARTSARAFSRVSASPRSTSRVSRRSRFLFTGFIGESAPALSSTHEQSVWTVRAPGPPFLSGSFLIGAGAERGSDCPVHSSIVATASEVKGGDPRAHIRAIVDASLKFEDVSRFAHVADRDEIEENGYNLNISRYVDTSTEEERVDVGEALARLRELERERDAAVAKMNRLLAELGYA